MKISVYVTSYNQAGFLVEAVDSVLAQTHKPHEIIIVDDCSSDGSRQIIESYADRHPGLIVPLLHERNVGITRSRIDALERVSGDTVTFVDGDDRFLPEKLEREASTLRASDGCSFAFSNLALINEAGERIGLWDQGTPPPQGNVFAETFAREFPTGRLFRSELVDYAAWKRIGFHDPRLPNLYEDYDMRIRLTHELRGAYCPEVLHEYRLNPAGLSRVPMQRHFDALDFIYRKNLHLLDALNSERRAHVRRAIGAWIGTVARRAVDECVADGRHVRATQLLAQAYRYDRSEVDLRLVARATLPGPAYRGARAVKRVLGSLRERFS